MKKRRSRNCRISLTMENGINDSGSKHLGASRERSSVQDHSSYQSSLYIYSKIYLLHSSFQVVRRFNTKRRCDLERRSDGYTDFGNTWRMRYVCPTRTTLAAASKMCVLVERESFTQFRSDTTRFVFYLHRI